MFDDPPGCWLHRQASFINASFPEGTESGVDYDWFPFPPIDQEGTPVRRGVGGHFREPSRGADFLEKFMSEDVQCAIGAEPGSSRISPNVNVGPDCYTNPILADSSAVLTEALQAGTGRFDASDLMPAAGRLRELLDRDGDVHAGRSGLAHRRPRRHRGELAGRVAGAGSRANGRSGRDGRSPGSRDGSRREGEDMKPSESRRAATRSRPGTRRPGGSAVLLLLRLVAPS